MFPARLEPGDEIRVIAPSTSMALVKGEQLQLAKERLENLGFHVTFGQHVEEHDEFFLLRLNTVLKIYTKLFKINK